MNPSEPSQFSDLLKFDELFNKRLLEPLFSQWDLLIAFLPKAIAAVLILFVGLLIGIVLSMITRSVLHKMGIDKLSRNAGVDAMMSEGGLTSTPSRLIGKVVFWLVFFATLMPASELLGISELTQLMASFVNFLPKIIAAIIIVVFGFVVANFLRQAVQGSSGSLGLTSTKTIGGLVYGLTVAITIVVALGQMGMDTQLLYTVLITIIASMGLAIALAVGLGGVRWRIIWSPVFMRVKVLCRGRRSVSVNTTAFYVKYRHKIRCWKWLMASSFPFPTAICSSIWCG